MVCRCHSLHAQLKETRFSQRTIVSTTLAASQEPLSFVNVQVSLTIICFVCFLNQMLLTDLGEDAGSGGDSAVDHTVENGEQAVQREGLWPQKVVTRLEK